MIHRSMIPVLVIHLHALAFGSAGEAAGQTEPASQSEPAPEAEAASPDGPMSQWQFGVEVTASYTVNFDSPESGTSFARVFDSDADSMTLNQVDGWIEKPISDESRLGFGVDVIAGSDAKKIHAAGLGSADDPFDLTQAYLTYRMASNLDLKAGKFVTMHGAETIRRSGNFNVSRGLLFGFAIPFTHTGAMVTWRASDAATLTAGVVNGWDNAQDNNSEKSLHGMLSLVPSEKLSLYLGGTWGAEQADSSSPKRGLVDAIAVFSPTEHFKLTFNYDYGSEDEIVPDPQSGRLDSASWQGLAAYATYDTGEKLSFGVRGEYFNDDDGFRFGYADPFTGDPAKLDLWEVTLTARYRFRDGLIASLEYRHDQSTDDQLVFNDGLDDSQDTIALELHGQF